MDLNDVNGPAVEGSAEASEPGSACSMDDLNVAEEVLQGVNSACNHIE
jgi:hypothetical protein